MAPKRVIVTLPLDRSGALAVRAGLPGLSDPRDAAAACEVLARGGAEEFLLTCVEAGDASASPHIDVLAPILGRLAGIGRPVAVRTEPADAEAAGRLLEAGAARVVIGAAALSDPDFIARLVDRFASTSVAVAVTAARENDLWRVWTDDGEPTEWQAVTWARVIEAQGAGELWVSAPNPDDGPYDLELLASLGSALHIPIVAAGEARSVEDLFDALMIGDADGVTCAGLFLSGTMTVREARADLAEHGLHVREG